MGEMRRKRGQTVGWLFWRSCMWHRIWSRCKEKHHIRLITHLYPDGDGVGSGIALTELLRLMGKESFFLGEDPLPPGLSFLDERGIWREWEQLSPKERQEIDLLIILDTHRRDRLGPLNTLLDQPACEVICIDHHVLHQPVEADLLINADACAVGAMIYRLFQESNKPLTLLAAKGIYASLICDTGRFSGASTSQEAHQLAEQCLARGVDPESMHANLFQRLPLDHLRILGKILSRMESHCNGRLLVQEVRRSDYESHGMLPHDFDVFHEMNKTVQGVECACLLRELPHHRIRISLRSTTSLNVGDLLMQRGGGGHPRAAGAILSGTLDAVKTDIIDLIGNHLDGSSS